MMPKQSILYELLTSGEFQLIGTQAWINTVTAGRAAPPPRARLYSFCPRVPALRATAEPVSALLNLQNQ